MNKTQGQGRSGVIAGGEESEGKGRTGFSWEDTEVETLTPRWHGEEERAAAGRELKPGKMTGHSEGWEKAQMDDGIVGKSERRIARKAEG